jgi:hypothetical protein
VQAWQWGKKHPDVHVALLHLLLVCRNLHAEKSSHATWGVTVGFGWRPDRSPCGRCARGGKDPLSSKGVGAGTPHLRAAKLHCLSHPRGALQTFTRAI